MQNRRSVVPGVILVIIGVAILGQINNWWDLDWRLAVVFWPLYLILIGIRLLLPSNRRTDWLFAALLVAGTAALLTTPTPTLQRLAGLNHYENRTSQVNQVGAADTDQLKLDVNAGATNIQLTSLGADATELYTATSHGANLQETAHRTNRTVNAQLEQSGNWLSLTGQLQIAIARQPQLALNIEAGASNLNLDLSDLNLTALKLDGGANHTVVKLGHHTNRQAITIDGGATNFRLLVPRDAGLNITNDSGFTSTNFDQIGLTKTDQTYRSTNFDSAEQQIIITFDGGASSITIERY